MSRVLALVLLAAMSAGAYAEPGHKCVANCDIPAAPAPDTSAGSPGGPDPMQQQMIENAGQLGFMLGTALGRALSGQGDLEKAQQLNNQAIAAAQRGDWFGAKALTEQALKLAPDDPQLKQNLAFLDNQIATLKQQEAASRNAEMDRRALEEREAAARRREQIAQRVEGQLKLAGGDATASATGDNSLGLKLGDDKDDGDLHYRGTGTQFFGLGGKPSDRPPPNDDPHVVDLRDAANGQAVGGAGMQRGPADKAPNPLGLKMGSAGGDAGVVDLRPATPRHYTKAPGSLDQLLARSDSDPLRTKSLGLFMMRTMPEYLAIQNWSDEDRAKVADLAERIDAHPVDDAHRALYGRSLRMDPATYAALAAAARNGIGRDLIHAGFQSENDCTVFAIANATNTPYSVTATRALELVRSAPWREPSERANPRRVFNPGPGLRGGEVDILAQEFGEARAVPERGIPGELAAGRAVVTSIGMPSGNHEVVVTRMFQYRGNSYYEVMDSNASAAGCPACRNSRTYWPRDEFESVMTDTGLTVVPKEHAVARSLK